MKLVIDIPDTIIPAEIRTLIHSGLATDEQNRRICEAFLRLACEEFDDCKITVDQYRLVLTDPPGKWKDEN